MKHPAESWLEAIEAVDLGAADGRLDLLATLLIQRQEFLDQLQKTDVSELSEGMRAQLHTRLEGVVQRDQLTLHSLHEALEITRKGLEQVAQGRVASRGYATALSQQSGKVLPGA